MANLKINGQIKEFDALPGSLSDLLDILGVDKATVVAEVDGEIVGRGDFGSRELSAGASIELIRLVGGG